MASRMEMNRPSLNAKGLGKIDISAVSLSHDALAPAKELCVDGERG